MCFSQNKRIITEEELELLKMIMTKEEIEQLKKEGAVNG